MDVFPVLVVMNAIDVTDEDVVRWQDRIVFGSDFPILPHPYEDARAAPWPRDLPMRVYQKILHGNAARLFEL
jgi:uncharacterized protein